MRKTTLALLLLAATLPATAQRSLYNKYLIPLATEEVAGGNGSVWRTQWVVHNASTRAADLIWNRGEQQIAPRTTVMANVDSRALSAGSQGAFVYVPKSADPSLGMSFRVRDLSQNAGSFGTELPIVSEEEFTRSIYLVDIPTDPKYRATLRVYGPDETTIPVRVTVFAEGSTAAVHDATVQLEGVVFVQQPEFPLYPAYAELDPLTAEVRAAGPRVRVVLQSDAPIWGFVSITNNETQQVTTVTPKHAGPRTPAGHNRYLVPVSTRQIDGVNGSIWKGEWTLHNFLDRPFDMQANTCPPNVSPCPGPTVAAQVTVKPALIPRDDTDGGFIYIPRDADSFVGMSMRVRDLSKNAGSFGTEIPIVGEDDYTSPSRPSLYLLDIPTDPKYRATLRLYGVNHAPQTVQVIVYPEGTSTPIDVYFVELNGYVTVLPEEFPFFPAYAQIDPLTPAVRAAAVRVRIELYSADWSSLVSPPPIYPMWGFLTVTDNTTQQVTAVTHSK